MPSASRRPWYVLSKESYMKRVMSEVFPTDCSPRNTSLNFLSGLPKSPEVDMVTFAHAPEASVGDRIRVRVQGLDEQRNWVGYAPDAGGKPE